ncbi:MULTISPECIES: hypothetical protein [Luteibacter]|uniref:hypothetical protein n=1 Tax=Luteibacter sp. dw_328 TaxID=2719796 RepID=UPI000A83D0CD|nr:MULTISPECIES: hypothetical protein [Luteibacter]
MKYVIRLCFICAFLGGAGFMVAEYEFQQTLPRKPDEKSGHVNPRNNHGVVVYYTDGEMRTSGGLFGGGMVVGLVGALLQVRERRLGRE